MRGFPMHVRWPLELDDHSEVADTPWAVAVGALGSGNAKQLLSSVFQVVSSSIHGAGYLTNLLERRIYVWHNLIVAAHHGDFSWTQDHSIDLCC